MPVHNLASQIFVYDIAISNNYHYHFFYLHILLSPTAAFIVELIIVVNIEQSRLSQLQQKTILKWFTELVRFDPFIKMSILFVFSVILILIPPSLSQLECFKCEERRDTNGTLISGNCMSDLTNAEIKIVNCLYKCSILHASDRKWHELKIRKWCHFKYIKKNTSSWTRLECSYERLCQKRGLLWKSVRKILKYIDGLLSYLRL